MSEKSDQLRKQVLGLVAEYHAEAFAPKPFVAGETPVPVSGRVFDATELQYLVDASLDFWLTTGRFAEEFEREFAAFSWRPPRDPREFGVVCESPGVVVPDFTASSATGG